MWHITPLDKIQQCIAQSAEACSQEPPEHHFPTKIAASLFLDELHAESVIDPISGFHIRELRRVRPRSGAPDRFLRSLKDDLDEKFEGSEPGEIKGVNMVTTATSRVLPVSYGIFRNVRSDGGGTWKLVFADRADKHVRHRFSTKDSGEGDPRVTGEIDKAVDAFRDLIYKEYGSATWEFRPESTEEFDRAIAADMAAILSCVYYVEEYLSPLSSGSERLFIGSASYLFNHLIQSDGSLAGQVPYFSGFDARAFAVSSAARPPCAIGMRVSTSPWPRNPMRTCAGRLATGPPRGPCGTLRGAGSTTKLRTTRASRTLSPPPTMPSRRSWSTLSGSSTSRGLLLPGTRFSAVSTDVRPRDERSGHEISCTPPMPLHSRMMRHVRRPRRTRKVKCWAGVAGKLGLAASALEVGSDGCLDTVGIANP